MTSRLHVDLDRFRSNIDILRRLVAPAEVMLVVKCDAYGHGLERMVRAAWDHGVRRFGAFDIAAGVRVRAAAGPDAFVFAWVTMTTDEVRLAELHRITLGVGDPDYLERIAAVSHGARMPVHLKIDTGLHRSGVRPEEWAAFAQRAAQLQAAGDIVVEGVWSHIAETSDRDDDAARTEFVDAVATAEAAGLAPLIGHLAASAAGATRSEFRFDVVRFGAFAYGIRPVGSAAPQGVLPVATLLASVTRVDAEAVTIGCGSLDGLPSTLAGRVDLGTPGGPRRLLGVGDVECTVRPWPGAAVGDEVAVWGPGDRGESDATDLAEAIGTVGEEIMVRLSPLVPRDEAPAAAR